MQVFFEKSIFFLNSRQIYYIIKNIKIGVICVIKAVIFDLDGTLANTLYDLQDAVNRALLKYGFPEHSLEEYRRFVGNGMDNLVFRASGECENEEMRAKIKKEFLDYYALHSCDKTVAYDGTKELLADVKALGLKTAVVTNKDDAAAKVVVNDLFGDAFDIVAGHIPPFAHKPDPALTLHVMEMLGVKPCECVFLGDSGVDIKTGVNSGAVAVGETWGYRDEDELVAAGAKYIIHNPNEFIGLLKEIDNEL